MITEIRLAESRCWDQYTPASQPQEDLRGARLLRVSQRVFAALVAHPNVFRFYREYRKPRLVAQLHLWPFFKWARRMSVTDAEALARALGVGRVEVRGLGGRDAEAVMRTGQVVIFRDVIS